MPAPDRTEPGAGQQGALKRRGAAHRGLLATLAIVAALGTGACSHLLPTASDRAPLPWDSYEEAMRAVAGIQPYATTRAQLHERRFDPATNPSITILNYTDLLLRLPAVPAVPVEHLEHGIADCLEAGRRCSAYQVQVRQTKTRRAGNFWLDLFNFRRESVTTGWSFTALIVFVDDTVVYALAGGQPRIEETQTTRNPLGPFQGIGSSLPIP